MYNKTILRPIFLMGMIAALFAACDKDFDQLGTDIVGDDHFSTQYSDASIAAFNQDLGPISSNNLALNPLGFYSDDAFGDTHANFVTQVVIADANLSPVFNNTDPTLYQTLPSVDSVIVEIPYFSHISGTVTTTNGVTVTPYALDSIYGQKVSTETTPNPAAKFKLSVYRSGYFLRDYDPDQAFGASQLFYTSQDGLIDANKIGQPLNNFATADDHEKESFYFDERQHSTSVLGTDGVTPVYTRTAPSMRLHLSTSDFKDMILNAPSGQLANNEVFKNYFRGLYFKTENGSPGNMAMINFAAGKITMYYQEDLKVIHTTGDPTYDRPRKTFIMNLTGNSVSLQNNTRTAAFNAALSNPGQQAQRLYLKGGPGSMAVIDIFGSADNYRYDILKNTAGQPIDISGNVIAVDSKGNPLSGYLIYIKTNTPNTVSDELDDLRYPLVDGLPAGSPAYYSKEHRWLINEANLTFYVDQSKMATSNDANRVYLYDLKNKKVLVDYTLDFTSNPVYLKYNKYTFGGIYLNQDGTIVYTKGNEKAYKYKIRITNHIRNLISNDSTNVRLGLVVTENINSVTVFSKRLTPGTDAVISAPNTSVMSPLGTILYGTNVPFGDPDYEKRLKLQIYYTKPSSN